MGIPIIQSKMIHALEIREQENMSLPFAAR
jgi:hypothetical protein